MRITFFYISTERKCVKSEITEVNDVNTERLDARNVPK